MTKKTKFSSSNKMPGEEALEKIDEICIEQVGEEYRVKIDNDDGGRVINVLFEEEVPQLARDLLRSPFFGWRLVRTIVPKGYLAVFYPFDNPEKPET